MVSHLELILHCITCQKVFMPIFQRSKYAGRMYIGISHLRTLHEPIIKFGGTKINLKNKKIKTY